jgi:hypothetical protein
MNGHSLPNYMIRLAETLESSVPVNHDDINNTRSIIEKILSLDMNMSSVDDFASLGKILTSTCITNHRISPFGLRVFRARKTNQKPIAIADVGSPPAESVMKMGRVNRTGQSVFYSSLDRSAACFEVLPSLGDWVAISSWRVNAPLCLVWIGYSTDVLTRLSAEDRANFSTQLESILGSRPFLKIIHNFIADRFSQSVPDGSENNYKITIGLAEAMLCREINPSLVAAVESDGLGWATGKPVGFMYPSIGMSGRADNVVISEEVFKRYVHLERVEWARVIEWRNPLQMNLGIADKSVSIDPSGAICWAGPPTF